MNEQMSGDETEQVQLYSWNGDKASSQPAANGSFLHTYTHVQTCPGKHTFNHRNTHTHTHTHRGRHRKLPRMHPAHTPHSAEQPEWINSGVLLWVLKTMRRIER